MYKQTDKGIGENKNLLAEEVFQHIGRMIVQGELAPGQRIRDVAVAADLHVSRTPVREALQRLERLGLVTMYPSRYTEVTAVTPETVEQTLEFAGYQAGIAARMSVPRLADEERAHAASLVDGLLASIDDEDRISEARWGMFSYLSDHSQNTQHRQLVQESGMALFRNLAEWRVPDEDRERMREIYADFRTAILQNDADRAESLARAMHYV